ncbi:MAG: LD-carboxypeptidase [Bacteroidia bacterium]|nr:LD-carboxypeptidase [Bacteroidia bacterium]
MKPPFLVSGDKIAIVACARKVSHEEMASAIALIHKQGFIAVEGANLYGENRQFSGTDEQRASDMQQMLDDPTIKAIWCARGGYGCARIIDKINFDNFVKHPKWLIGFSDFTVFHSHVFANFNIPTLHAIMPISLRGALPAEEENNILKDKSAFELFKFLKGEDYFLPVEDKNIEVEGVITGGNISVLYSMLGSSSDINTDGKILFLEDLDEYYYHIDRMMMAMKRAGKLKNLKTLLVGEVKDMRDNTIPFGHTVHEIISDHVAEYDYPVIYNMPVGHVALNLPLPFGMNANIRNGIITFAG